jgi:regulator of protease activity HflC (stomatin/prohibitin superfamily)
MSEEIRAAKNSLAATEKQLNLDASMLRMALELAGEVAKIYKQASASLAFAVLLADDLAEQAQGAVRDAAKAGGNAEGSPRWAAFWRSVLDLQANGGEGGIRTLERACAPYSLSRRVPSATRPPLRASCRL